MSKKSWNNKRKLTKIQNNDEPPKKRAKTAQSTQILPLKPEQKLTDEQISSLPILMNPTLYKTVFESFRLKKKLPKPVVSFKKIETQEQKKFEHECNIKIIKKGVQVLNESFVSISRKSAEIGCYKMINHKYCEYNLLKKLMIPYALTRGIHVKSVILREGTHLKNKTSCIIIKPLPLECTEIDLILFINKMINDDTNYYSEINHFKFIRENNKAIYQSIVIQLNNMDTTHLLVDKLNHKMYKNSYKLNVDYYDEMLKPNYTKLIGESKHLYISGWKPGLQKKDIKRFLYENNIEFLTENFHHRYAFIPSIVVDTGAKKIATKIYEQHLETPYINEEKYPLYIRFAEGKEMRRKKIETHKTYQSITKRSKSIDINNINWDVSETSIYDIFKVYGDIIKCQLNARKDLFPGTCYIEYDSEDSAENAVLNENGYILNGLKLKVNLHLKQSKEDKKMLKALHKIIIDEENEQKKLTKRDNLLKKKRKNQKRRDRRKRLKAKYDAQ